MVRRGNLGLGRRLLGNCCGTDEKGGGARRDELFRIHVTNFQLRDDFLPNGTCRAAIFRRKRHARGGGSGGTWSVDLNRSTAIPAWICGSALIRSTRPLDTVDTGQPAQLAWPGWQAGWFEISRTGAASFEWSPLSVPTELPRSAFAVNWPATAGEASATRPIKRRVDRKRIIRNRHKEGLSRSSSPDCGLFMVRDNVPRHRTVVFSWCATTFRPGCPSGLAQLRSSGTIPPDRLKPVRPIGLRGSNPRAGAAGASLSPPVRAPRTTDRRSPHKDRRRSPRDPECRAMRAVRCPGRC